MIARPRQARERPMPIDLAGLIEERRGDKFQLFDRHLNAQLLRILRTLGFAVDYVRAEGPHLFDADGNRYLDLLSGFGVFALGRNHPTVTGALEQVLRGQLAGPGPVRRIPARRPARRAPHRLHALAAEAVLLQLRRGGHGGGDQVQPRRDRPLDHPVLRPRLPWPDLRRRVAVRRRAFSRPLRAVRRRLRAYPVQ